MTFIPGLPSMMPHPFLMRIHALTVEQRASTGSLAALCATMYASIGIAWLVYFRLPAKFELKEPLKLALLCLSWTTTSIGMSVLNKSLMSVLPVPELICSIQMVVISLCMLPFSIRSLLETERRQLQVWLVVPLLFAGMLCSSFYTLSYMSLSLITLLRTLTPLVVLPIERLVMPADKVPSFNSGLILSLFVMVIGALVYVDGLEGVSMVGCAFALLNTIMAAGDRLIQRRFLTNECQGIDSSVCTLLNHLLGMVPLLVLAHATGQLESFMDGRHKEIWLEPNVMAILAMSCVVGIGICYLGFECQRSLSATSFFVMQNLSRACVIIAGVAFFGDPITSPYSFLGVLVTLGGSFNYGRLQLLEQHKQDDERKKLLP